MQIPKKISPDSIKDSLVELRYTSKLPFEVIIGLFFQLLDESYTYTNRPMNMLHSIRRVNPNQHSIVVEETSIVFYNQKIRIKLKPDSFVFSCLDKYLGWEEFSNEIEKVIVLLSSSKIVEKYVRIGLRYITEYHNVDLQKCVDFKFSFGMTHVKSETYTFHSEFRIDDYRVILNLSSKVPISVQSASNLDPQITRTSLVDIDVISEGFEENDMVGLLNRLDGVHSKEKEIFFNLLNKEFLRTLQPEY